MTRDQAPAQPAATSQPRRTRERQAEPSRPERYCPNCNAELVEFRCKLLCPNRECGYSMSCSDFY